MLVPTHRSTTGWSNVVIGFPSGVAGLVMLTPVPLTTGVGAAEVWAVGCCAKASPVTASVDATANDVIQDPRVMIATSLVTLEPT
jgi:hypothetical protein